jgi:hypothetical protein
LPVNNELVNDNSPGMVQYYSTLVSVYIYKFPIYFNFYIGIQEQKSEHNLFQETNILDFDSGKFLQWLFIELSYFYFP